MENMLRDFPGKSGSFEALKESSLYESTILDLGIKE
jgi:hypothetical protein